MLPFANHCPSLVRISHRHRSFGQVSWNRKQHSATSHSLTILETHKLKMKIFQSTVKFLESLGITLQSRSLNVRSSITIILLGTMTSLICAFLFCEASNFKEYTESIYMSSVTIAIFTTYLFVIWKREHLFQFIDCWEEIAVTSAYFELIITNMSINAYFGVRFTLPF